MSEFIKTISVLAIPTFIFGVLGYGYFKRINVYEAFIEGAKEGLATTWSVLPYLVAMFVAIGIFRSSGAMDVVIKILTPITNFFGIPAEIIPLVLIRPMSGSASTGMLAELFKTYGPDSFVGRVASTMMGSTETIFYTLSIYFGAVGIKRIRYTMWAALIAEIAGLIASVIICRIVFGI